MKNNKIISQKLKPSENQTSSTQETQKSNSQVNKKITRNRKLALRFSPTAWAKLLYFRDLSDNEVGGFGITEPDDLLFVTEFVTVKQQVTCVSVKFDDEAVANFFEDQVDLGIKPEQFARLWLHSHPADSPEPSSIDESTFTRVFGNCQWAVMFIVAQNNRSYAKLSFNVGPGGQILIPVEIDYSRDFSSSDKCSWDTEYKKNVEAADWFFEPDNINETSKICNDYSGLALPYDFIEELEKMEPQERHFILDELADRPDLWDEESEVMYL